MFTKFSGVMKLFIIGLAGTTLWAQNPDLDLETIRQYLPNEIASYSDLDTFKITPAFEQIFSEEQGTRREAGTLAVLFLRFLYENQLHYIESILAEKILDRSGKKCCPQTTRERFIVAMDDIYQSNRNAMDAFRSDLVAFEEAEISELHLRPDRFETIYGAEALKHRFFTPPLIMVRVKMRLQSQRVQEIREVLVRVTDEGLKIAG